MLGWWRTTVILSWRDYSGALLDVVDDDGIIDAALNEASDDGSDHHLPAITLRLRCGQFFGRPGQLTTSTTPDEGESTRRLTRKRRPSGDTS